MGMTKMETARHLGIAVGTVYAFAKQNPCVKFASGNRAAAKARWADPTYRAGMTKVLHDNRDTRWSGHTPGLNWKREKIRLTVAANCFAYRDISEVTEAMAGRMIRGEIDRNGAPLAMESAA